MAKIAIVGTGAMGSVYAGLLADAGHDVWAIDVWAEHIEAIRERGLRVEGASGDRVTQLSASTRAQDAGRCDLVIIATKAAHVVSAAKNVPELMGPDTVVLSLQNGLGSGEQVTDVLGHENVIIGIVGGFGASMRAPGHVHHNGWEMVHLAELRGPETPRLREVAGIWASAGFSVGMYSDADRMIWEKLICNVCFSGTCTLTGLTIGEVIDSRQAWRVASGCATEAWEVARALGVGISIEDPVDHVRRFGLKIPAARPSMALDNRAGRRCEIDVINGAIPLQAARVGLSAPFNEVVSALVRQSEASFA